MSSVDSSQCPHNAGANCTPTWTSSLMTALKDNLIGLGDVMTLSSCLSIPNGMTYETIRTDPFTYVFHYYNMCDGLICLFEL